MASLQSNAKNPDIYYIVLDGYARSDVLKDLYGYDNSSFTNYLREKGFIVPDGNHSNYSKTSLSIPSTLNMDYIQTLLPELEESHFWWLTSPLVDYNRTRTMLEEIGYQSVSIGVDWTITNNKTTDLYYVPSLFQLSEFESHLLRSTPLTVAYPFLDRVAYIPLSAQAHREIISFNFDTLSEISKLSGAQFVFSHVVAPHPPFLFDKDGNAMNLDKPYSVNDAEGFKIVRSNEFSEEEILAEYRQGYIEQVQYVNKSLIKVIDDILEYSDTPPIIILQADHGSGMLTDFSSIDNTCLHERFSPFAAYYLPGADEDIIPPDISSVNLFRIIFNEYFQADLPLLENAYFFSTDPFYVYRFEEVSLEKVEAPCE